MNLTVYWREIKAPAHLRQCRDSSEVKSRHFSPAVLHNPFTFKNHFGLTAQLYFFQTLKMMASCSPNSEKLHKHLRRDDRTIVKMEWSFRWRCEDQVKSMFHCIYLRTIYVHLYVYLRDYNHCKTIHIK